MISLGNLKSTDYSFYSEVEGKLRTARLTEHFHQCKDSLVGRLFLP